MTIYTVHVPEEARPGSPEGLERTVLVKDGLHWLALVFPVLWLLANRAWIALAAVILATLAIFLARYLGLSWQGVAGLDVLLALFVAINAGPLKSHALGRRGFPAVDVVSADSPAEAERRFFERWLDRAAQAPAAASNRTAAGGFGPTPDVLGLFPGGVAR